MQFELIKLFANLNCNLSTQPDLVTRTLPDLSPPRSNRLSTPSLAPVSPPPPPTRGVLCVPSNPLPLLPQLSLRVKALKRQVDESEGEVERLEGVRRKVLRDLEEQQELREALHAKVSALENELK